MRGVNHFGASGLLAEWDRKEAEQPHRCGSRPTHGLTAGRLSPIMGSGGSADLTFDHAGDRAVTDGGAVADQLVRRSRLGRAWLQYMREAGVSSGESVGPARSSPQAKEHKAPQFVEPAGANGF